MSQETTGIDRAKLRTALQQASQETIFYMLDEAFGMLGRADLEKIVARHLDVKRLRIDGRETSMNVLAEARAFETASVAGKYYESFRVDSKNYTMKSRGTIAWIAECRRLLDRCVEEAVTEDASEVRQTFDMIFGLLDRIDECRGDVIFFADEAGAWQVGVNWEKVLPAWFAVLSKTAAPDEYASRVVRLLKHHYDYGSARMLVLASESATPAQREALAEQPRSPKRT